MEARSSDCPSKREARPAPDMMTGFVVLIVVDIPRRRSLHLYRFGAVRVSMWLISV